MRKLLLIFVTVSINFCFAQKKILELPEGGEKLYCCFSHVFNFRVDKNRKIFFNEESIELEKLKDAIIDEKNRDSVHKGSPRMYLYADKSIGYNYIDSIKLEISKSLIAGNITYITQSKDSVYSYGVPKILFKPLIKTIRDHVEKPVYGFSKNTTDISSLVEEVKKSNIRLLMDNLYDYNFNEFNHLLKEVNYGIVYFNKDNYITINDVKIEIEDIEKLGAEMRKYKYIFIKFKDNLSYQSYVNMSYTVRKTYYFYARKEIRLPQYFEITNQIQQLFKKHNVKI